MPEGGVSLTTLLAVYAAAVSTGALAWPVYVRWADRRVDVRVTIARIKHGETFSPLALHIDNRGEREVPFTSITLTWGLDDERRMVLVQSPSQVWNELNEEKAPNAYLVTATRPLPEKIPARDAVVINIDGESAKHASLDADDPYFTATVIVARQTFVLHGYSASI